MENVSEVGVTLTEILEANAKSDKQIKLAKIYARLAEYSSEEFDYQVIYALHKQATLMLKGMR